MSRRNPDEKFKMTSYDEMFGSDEENRENNSRLSAPKSEGQILELSIENLVAFKKHPFKVLDDEKMDETVESIKAFGVLVPIIVRPISGEIEKYEILSGHRRCHASKLADKKMIPAIIKDCTDDESVVIMVDANIQREDISIIEKSKAYRMKYDALKHQGSPGGSSLDAMSEVSGDNPKMIQRLIRLSYLSEDLMKLVDDKKLGFIQGVDISFLSENEQKEVYEIVTSTNISVSLEQALNLKEAYKKQELTVEKIQEILINKRKVTRKISFNSKKLDPYFTSDISNQDIEELILRLLEEWKERGGEA